MSGITSDDRATIRLPHSETELLKWNLVRHLTLPDGAEAEIIMTAWHWDTLRWLVMELGRPLPDILAAAIRLRRCEPLSQTLQWWLEAYYDAYEDLEADGLV